MSGGGKEKLRLSDERRRKIFTFRKVHSLGKSEKKGHIGRCPATAGKGRRIARERKKSSCTPAGKDSYLTCGHLLKKGKDLRNLNTVSGKKKGKIWSISKSGGLGKGKERSAFLSRGRRQAEQNGETGCNAVGREKKEGNSKPLSLAKEGRQWGGGSRTWGGALHRGASFPR